MAAASRRRRARLRRGAAVRAPGRGLGARRHDPAGSQPRPPGPVRPVGGHRCGGHRRRGRRHGPARAGRRAGHLQAGRRRAAPGPDPPAGEAPDGFAADLALSADGRWLAVGGDQSVHLYERMRWDSSRSAPGSPRPTPRPAISARPWRCPRTADACSRALRAPTAPKAHVAAWPICTNAADPGASPERSGPRPRPRTPISATMSRSAPTAVTRRSRAP